MKGKNVLITGATGGIGFIAARELAKKGAHVIATGRNPQKGSLAVNQIKKVVLESRSLGSIEFKELDLASFRSIKRFVREYLTSQPSFTLDVLILNAGVMMTPFSLTEDGLELQIGTVGFLILLFSIIGVHKANILNCSRIILVTSIWLSC